MKFFGFHITKALTNKFTPHAMVPWFFGKNWASSQDMTSLLNAYKSWVYVCASRNAATFAATPLRLFVAKPKSSTKLLAPTRSISKKHSLYLRSNPKIASLPQVVKAVEIEEITEHPAIDLMHNVNPFMNQSDLLELSDLYEELTGNSFWYIVKNALGVPAEIWPLPPDRVRIIPDPKLFIKEYRFFTSLSSFQRGGTQFEIDEIVHFKFPNPTDMYYGASPLQAVSDSYNINQNMNTFENALFTNNARPEGLWTTEQELDGSDTKRLTKMLSEMYQGVFNAGKSGLLSHGLKYTPLNFSPRELGFMKGREWTKKEIYEAYDTPSGLFSEKANRANAEASQYVYAKYCIQPRHRRFEEKLNEQLAPMFDEKLFFAFDNVVPADRELQLREDTELAKASIKSIDEIRLTREMEPLPDGAGAVPYIGQGFIPITAAQFGMPAQEEVEEPKEVDEEKMVQELSNEIVEQLLRQVS